MLDVSDDVRAEIGPKETDRLLAGEGTPGNYDCTSCRAPGDSDQEQTSTVLFLGGETAVLAFAHASCIPSQVVRVSEERLQDAVRSITGQQITGRQDGDDAPTNGVPGTRQPASRPTEDDDPAAEAPASAPVRGTPAPRPREPQPAVLGVTCGQVLVHDELHPALVVEPTSAISRPGSTAPGDAFLPVLIEQGFQPIDEVGKVPTGIDGWSVLLATGRLHAILQPDPEKGSAITWWQAHQPLTVTAGWRTAANRKRTVFVYAAPAGSIGPQPREDLLREALESAASRGVLVAAAMPLTGS